MTKDDIEEEVVERKFSEMMEHVTEIINHLEKACNDLEEDDVPIGVTFWRTEIVCILVTFVIEILKKYHSKDREFCKDMLDRLKASVKGGHPITFDLLSQKEIN